jgi:hypothetical protein
MKAALLTVKLAVFLFYGLGGSLTSPGMNTLGQELGGLPGVQVYGPYYYDQWQTVVTNMQALPPGMPIALEGYSCGVGSTAWAATAAGLSVALIAGIQGSDFCPPTPLTPNIKAAAETYNPNCLETFWLGCATYTPGPGFNPGKITLVQRPDLHPYADLDPDALADMVAATEAAISASAAGALKIARGIGVPASPHILIRFRNQKLY